ncbi:MAG: DUF2203 domain-containing protein, partial [Thaumarchaeota archaeon]|nr:DUF2203 domain-containing protein [Nitrososphaerota archaeon]
MSNSHLRKYRYAYIAHYAGRSGSTTKVRWCYLGKKEQRLPNPSSESNHYFTLVEATSMLPEIKRRLKGILAGKKLADSLREEIERFSPLVFEVPGARQKNDQVDSIVKNVMEGISELEDLGVKLRDIDTGLLDFPAK